MIKTEAILPFVESINIKKSLYINAFDKKDLAAITKATKILEKIEDIIMLDIKHLSFNTKYTISNWSRLEILLIFNRFQFIKFNNCKKK